jgi:hypothetical protein
MAVRKRFWTLLARREGRFLPEFGSFVRGEAIAKMSELRLKGIRRRDLKIIASDPDLAAITKDIEALNDALTSRPVDTEDAKARLRSATQTLPTIQALLPLPENGHAPVAHCRRAYPPRMPLACACVRA